MVLFLSGSLAVGFARGELGALFAYDEEAKNKEEKEKAKETAAKKED